MTVETQKKLKELQVKLAKDRLVAEHKTAAKDVLFSLQLQLARMSSSTQVK